MQTQLTLNLGIEEKVDVRSLIVHGDIERDTPKAKREQPTPEFERVLMDGADCAFRRRCGGRSQMLVLLVTQGCVLSSLVEPPPSRICEPLPVAWRRMPNGIRHDKVSHPRHRNPSRSRQAPPPMRAWRTRQDSPLNCTSLPWWTTLSITAAAIWSSPKTLPQRLNSRLVVKTTDCRS